MLLTVPDWERVERRPVADRQGKPIISVDLGAGRAWSAAVATWKTGRVEALALAPGIPSIEAQEKRDRVPAGSYRKLVETGRLMIAHGLRVQTAKQLMDAAFAMWGKPAHVIADRFQIKALADATNGVKLIGRVTRWSEASEDIRATRKMALDGPMNVEPESRPLLAASLAHALVKNDDAGNSRLVKDSANNTGRDDVAAALQLGCGSYIRAQMNMKPRWRYGGAV